MMLYTTPNTVELIPTLGALFPRGGPVQKPVLTLPLVRSQGHACSHASSQRDRDREFFIDNLLVQIHFIIVVVRWTGLAPWEFEFPFPDPSYSCR